MQPLAHRSRSHPVLVLCLLAACNIFLAAKDFVKPAAQPAKTYPAHDEHASEKVGVAADPYDKPGKAKIFSVNFHEHGLLPVFFVITNDGDQPVSIAHMQVTLTTANNSRLTPITTDDVYRRLSNPQTREEPLPYPLPRTKVKGTVSRKELDEINSSQFAARAVEPRATQSGFLFFDIEDIADPLPGGTIYVTGVNDAKGTELMYFEIPMDKYLSAGRAK
jgi:hypothetical protein